MKLKDITRNRPLVGVLTGLLLLAVVITFAWCSASSEVDVPKADKYGQQSANAHAESVQSESDANATAIQIEAVDKQRQTAKQASRVASDKARKQSNKRKAEYEIFRQAPVVVSDSDLDARERKLLSDLTELYTVR